MQVFLQQYRRLGRVMDMSPNTASSAALHDTCVPVKAEPLIFRHGNLPLHTHLLPREGKRCMPVRRGVLLQDETVPAPGRNHRPSLPTTTGLMLVNGHLPCSDDGFSASLPSCDAALPPHTSRCSCHHSSLSHHTRQPAPSCMDDLATLSPPSTTAVEEGPQHRPPFATAVDQGPLQGVMPELYSPGLESQAATIDSLTVSETQLAGFDSAALMSPQAPASPSMNEYPLAPASPSMNEYPLAPQMMGSPDFPERLVGPQMVASSDTDAYSLDTHLMSSPTSGVYPARPQPWGTSGSGVRSSPGTAGYCSRPHSPSTTGGLLRPQLLGCLGTPQQSPPTGLSSSLFASRHSFQASKCSGD